MPLARELPQPSASKTLEVMPGALGGAQVLCASAPGFDRRAFHREFNAAVTRFGNPRRFGLASRDLKLTALDGSSGLTANDFRKRTSILRFTRNGLKEIADDVIDHEGLKEHLISTLQRVDEHTEAEEEAETLALLAAATVVLAWVFPGRAYTASQVGDWAPLHWVTGFASYGLIGAALLHAALLTHAERRLRSGTAGSGQIPTPNRPAGQALGMPLLRLESLTLKFVAAGFAMLTLTLLLGAAFTAPPIEDAAQYLVRFVVGGLQAAADRRQQREIEAAIGVAAGAAGQRIGR
mgnify:CR=1 FL=1